MPKNALAGGNTTGEEGGDKAADDDAVVPVIPAVPAAAIAPVAVAAVIADGEVGGEFAVAEESTKGEEGELITVGPLDAVEPDFKKL